MKVPFSWLKDCVAIEAGAPEIASGLWIEPANEVPV